MANILLNPGFETGSLDTFWAGYTSSGTRSDGYDTTNFVHGVQGLRVTAVGGVMDGGRQQTANENPRLTLLTRGTWLFSGYVMTGASVVNAHMLIRENTGFGVVAGGHVTTANTAWTFFYGYFYSDGLKNYDVIMGLGSYGAASDGVAYFDDISLEMIHIDNLRFPNQFKNIVVGDGMGRSEGMT